MYKLNMPIYVDKNIINYLNMFFGPNEKIKMLKLSGSLVSTEN